MIAEEESTFQVESVMKNECGNLMLSVMHSRYSTHAHPEPVHRPTAPISAICEISQLAVISCQRPPSMFRSVTSFMHLNVFVDLHKLPSTLCLAQFYSHLPGNFLHIFNSH
jgi:hypothetical protein